MYPELIFFNTSERKCFWLFYHQQQFDKFKSPGIKICACIFVQKYVLERHMKDKHGIHGEFTCSICGQSFYDARGLKFHNTVMHSENARYPYGRPKVKKDKLYSCNQCDKVLNSWIGLYQHKETVHHGVTYKCDQCTQVYRNAAGLRMHLQRVHGATLKYSCDGCSLKFYQASFNGVSGVSQSYNSSEFGIDSPHFRLT